MNIKQRMVKWSLIIGMPALLLLSGTWYVLERLPWVTEYHQRPPQRIFQEVMGKPVPAGISNLRISARHFFIKRWAWMRFQATDKAIRELVDDQAAVQRALQGKSWAANQKYNDFDMSAVGWNAVSHIPKPEVYQVSSNSEGFHWMGDMIVDRQNYTVYVHAGGD